MFDNIALDVAIGLVFIYLLYSLLATIVQEMLAQLISLRGRMLIKGIRVMLEDRHDETTNVPILKYFSRLITSIRKSFKHFYCPFPDETLAKKFYQHPSIKYLSESTRHNKPAYIGPVNFSDTMIKILRGANYDGSTSQVDTIKGTLTAWQNELNTQIETIRNNPDQSVRSLEKQIKTITVSLDGEPLKLGIETFHQLQQLFVDAQSDVDRFRAQLEKWFNSTMDRVNGWYKRQTQTILLIIGFGMACAFNVDSIAIYHVLAKDKTARNLMVQMAVKESPKMGSIIDSLNKPDSSKNKFDSTYKNLAKDANEADQIMGLGKPYCDSSEKYKLLYDSCIKKVLDTTMIRWGNINSDTLGKLNKLSPKLKEDYIKHHRKTVCKTLRKDHGVIFPDSIKVIESRRIHYWLYVHDSVRIYDSIHKAYQYKTCHLRYNPKQTSGWTTFWGWLITALAISLGAPFWFDTLNKLISLRSAGKKTDADDDKSSNKNSKDPSKKTQG